MILFVAAIQAIPTEINEATMVDGATFWQRTRRVTVPLTRRRSCWSPCQRDRLAPGVRPVLHHDRRPAVQPDLDAVFYIYKNSFPFLHLGYGAALSLILAAIILVFTSSRWR
jgi:ABC-type sugar transport systems, permease components